MNETLVKYLAGLLDADGSLSFNFKCDPRRKDRYFVSIKLTLAGSQAVDPFCFVENLPGITNIGTTHRSGTNKQFVTWTVARRTELEMLVPRLIKHMVVKARHWQWIFDKWREWRSGNKTCSKEERDVLTSEAKASRVNNTGPIKPKNHPTWAWLAGFIDGDGCYTFQRNFNKRDQKYNIHMRVSIVSHDNDIHVLHFIKKALGGYFCPHGQSDNITVWRRNLGVKDRSFALDFLKKMVRHSHLKRHKIEQMLSFLHQQRLSIPAPTGEATV